MILNTGKTIFVTDEKRTRQHFGNEQLIAEYNGQIYRISIDRTTIAAYYELFLEWEDNDRVLHKRLFASSSLSKIVAFVNQNL